MFLTCDNGLISAIFLRNLCVQETKPVRSLRNLCVTIDQCVYCSFKSHDEKQYPKKYVNRINSDQPGFADH